MSQFAFLEQEWPGVFDAAAKAEAAVNVDPRTACFYARRALEFIDLLLKEAGWPLDQPRDREFEVAGLS